MPVTERFEDPGSFVVKLDARKVPFDELRLFQELSNIVITSQWIQHPDLYAEADLLAAAKYSGVILKVYGERTKKGDDLIVLEGQGNVWYMGDAQGLGQRIGSQVTYSAETIDNIFTDLASGGILPDAITAGTVTTTGVGTYTGTFYATQTCLEAIRTVTESLGLHWRVNPDWSIDVCLATRDDVFTVTTPTVVAVPKEYGPGADPTYTGAEPTYTRSLVDGSRWVSESVIEEVDAAGARTAGSTSSRSSNPYQDPQGNALSRSVIQSGPSSDDVGFSTFHSRALAQFDVSKEQEIDLDQMELSGAFEPGDWIFIFDPERGFVDAANQVPFRGLMLPALKMQALQDSWPITPDHGVYARPNVINYYTAVLADGPLAYWRLDEPSGSTANDETGNGYDGTYTGTVTRSQTGVMQDGSDNDSADFHPANNGYVVTADTDDLKFIGTSVYTVEAWVDADTTEESGSDPIRSIVACFFSHSGGSDEDGWRLYWRDDGSGTLLFGAERQNATSFQECSAGGYALNEPHHVAMTFDGTILRLYVDGQHVASDSGTVSLPDGDQGGLTIGAVESGSGPPGSFTAFGQADGRIDEVAVYDSVVSETRLALHNRIGRQGSLGRSWHDLTRYVHADSEGASA